MSLLVTTVLLDVVKVVTTDNDGSGHLVLEDDSSEDHSSDWHVSSPWALLVDVGSLDGLKIKIRQRNNFKFAYITWSLESESDLTNVTWGLLRSSEDTGLIVKVNRRLLQERPLGLFRHFPRS